MAAELLPEALWEEIEPLLPPVHRRLLNRLGKLDGIDLQHVVVDSLSVRAVQGGRTPAPTRRTAANRAANAMR